MNRLNLGDHLVVSCGVYTHHGIYIGCGQVIHYAGFVNSFNKGQIEATSLESFLDSKDEFKVITYPSQFRYSTNDIVVRAKSRLGEDRYNLLFNNCEHFACWCVTGEWKSEQVQKVKEYTSTAIVS